MTTLSPTPQKEIEYRDVHMAVVRPNAPIEVTVVGNERCTAHKKSAGVVRHISIDVSGTPLEGKCQPGQSLGVLPDERAANGGKDPKTGNPHKPRLYSFSHPTRGEDGKGKVVSVTVKRLVDEHWDTQGLYLGVASNWLSDRRPGEKIKVFGPNGGKNFVLPKFPDQHDYFFFATGTGVAPFRGMVLDLLEQKVKCKIVLIMGTPYSTDLLYHDSLLRLANENPNFHYITAISREKNGDLDRLFIQDRIRTERDRLLPILSTDRALIYMCGLKGMELGILQELALNLNGAALRNFMEVENEALRNIRGWKREMLHKEVRPTKKIRVEVY